MAKKTIKATAPARAKAARVQDVRAAKHAIYKAGIEVAKEEVASRQERANLPRCQPYHQWAAATFPTETYYDALSRVPGRLRPIARRLVKSDLMDGIIEDKYYFEGIYKVLREEWKKRCGG